MLIICVLSWTNNMHCCWRGWTCRQRNSFSYLTCKRKKCCDGCASLLRHWQCIMCPKDVNTQVSGGSFHIFTYIHYILCATMFEIHKNTRTTNAKTQQPNIGTLVKYSNISQFLCVSVRVAVRQRAYAQTCAHGKRCAHNSRPVNSLM